jgi:acetoin utilization deacetylase AcuC-like enzyme
MQIIYSEKQADHQPRWEWNFGKKNAYPEKTARIRTIVKELNKRGMSQIIRQERSFALDHIHRIHDPEMVRHIKSCANMPEGESAYAHIFPYRTYTPHPKTNMIRAGYFCFDVGTTIARHTYVAAKSAVDVALTGAELIAKGKEREVFSLSRPPGHHADRRIYGGYCYFNNAAIAADYLSKGGKVAILDLDFHHGNGTQSIFYESSHVYFASIHGDPRDYYPYFCGFKSERGEYLGHKMNHNVPLPKGVDDAAYLAELDKVLTRIKRFTPAYLVISMGFDTFESDPVGDFALTSPCYHEIGARLRRLGPPVLAVLEGGYAMKELGVNAANFAEGLMGKE